MSRSILSDLIITKICSVSTMYTNAGAVNARRDRPRWAILLKYEGETEYTDGEQYYISNIEHAVILPRSCSYEWRCIKGGHYSVIELESPLACTEIMTFPLKNGHKVLEAIKRLEAKRTRRGELCELESIKDTYDILFMLLRSEPKKYQPAEKLKRIAPALDHIAQHYNESIRNDELAQLTGLSTVYFRKLFTELVGQSPIDYISSVRIRKAKEMLESDFSSITDIAASLGYPNIYDFSRAFKKHVGVSPKAYKADAEQDGK